MNELSLIEQARQKWIQYRLERAKFAMAIAKDPNSDFERIKLELMLDFITCVTLDWSTKDGFIKLNGIQYYAEALKKLDGEEVQILEHYTGILGVFYQGEFFTLAYVVKV